MNRLIKTVIIVGLLITNQHVLASGQFSSQLGVSYIYDDNLLKVNPALVESFDRSEDSIYKINAGLAFNWAKSKQNIALNANLYQSRYQNNSYLDGEGYNFSLVLGSRFSNRISGELSAVSSQSLSSFGPSLQVEKNNVLNFGVGYKINYEINKKVNSEFGFNIAEKSNTALQNKNLDRTESNYFFKVGYNLSPQLKLDLNYSLNLFKPDIQNGPLKGYEQNVASSNLIYTFSPKLKLVTSLARVLKEEEGELSSQSKLNYSASLNYEVSKKSQLSFRVLKSSLVSEVETSSYTDSKGWSIDLSHRLTRKLQFNLAYSRLSEVSDTIFDDLYIGTVLTDSNKLSASLSYRFLSSLGFDLSFNKVVKESSFRENSYSSNIIQLGLKLAF